MRKLVLVLLILLCFPLKTAYAHLYGKSDSGIYGPSYQQVVQKMQNLAQEYADQATYVQMGTSIQGRPLAGLVIGQKTKGYLNPQKLVYISGATHGNEYLHIADELPLYFLNKQNYAVQNYLSRGGIILIVPVLNPDGYDNRHRTNANGVDLNRDYANNRVPLQGFSQPETRAIGMWLDSFIKTYNLKMEVAVDYHCCDGSLLYPWSYTRARPPQEDLERYLYLAHLMNKYFPNYRHGITGEVLGYYPQGTSKDYYYLQYGALAFTFEGVYSSEDEKLQQHIGWWTDIISHL